VVSKALTFAGALVVARILGPRTLGPLAVAQTFAMGASMFADLGLTVVSMRDIVRRPRELSRVVSITLAVQCTAALLLTAVLLVLAAVAPFPSGSGRLLVLSSPLLIVMALSTVYALQGVEAMGLVALARLLGVVITAVGMVVSVIVTGSTAWVAVMSWVGLLAADAFAITGLRRRHGLRLTGIRLAECVALVHRATPFIVNGALAIALMIVDTASLSLFGTATDVGIYGVGWSLSFGAAGILVLVTDASFPEMVRRWHESPRRLRQFSDEVISMLSRLTFAGAALVSMESSGIVRLLLGSSFRGTATVLAILIWIVPVGAISMMHSFGMLASGAQKALVRRRLIAVSFALVSCPIAAVYGGPPEVALVILGAHVLETSLFAIRNARTGSSSPLRPWLSQVDFLAIPLVALLSLNLAWSTRPLPVAIVVWAIATLGAETRRGFSTARALLAWRRSAVPVVPQEPSGAPPAGG
jgi:PST family polysaccharide transporter